MKQLLTPLSIILGVFVVWEFVIPLLVNSTNSILVIIGFALAIVGIWSIILSILDALKTVIDMCDRRIPEVDQGGPSVITKEKQR